MRIKLNLWGCLLMAMMAFAPTAQAQEVTMDELMQWYKQYYLASAVDTMPWNGSAATCNAGTLPAEILRKAELRVNFFRLTNRLPLITMDSDSSIFPQHAALMMLANKRLSHYPSKNWKCYTAKGAKGAAASCLSLPGSENTDDFITGFIADIGESNSMVGHRRWILYTGMKRFSYGATTGSQALYCIMNDFDYIPSPLPYVAYPWSGYVPYNLIAAKWSFSIPEGPKVNFSKATVKATTAEGKKLKVRQYPAEEMLDATLVWFMEDLFTLEEDMYAENSLQNSGFVGQTITITISNVLLDGVAKNYTYQVKITDLDYLENQ